MGLPSRKPPAPVEDDWRDETLAAVGPSSSGAFQTTAATSATTSPGDEERRRFGGYLLDRRLAIGGMSEVYLAEPVEGAAPAARVVIKRLLPSLVDDAKARDAFLTEAEIHAAARHKNIVEMYEWGEADGEPYIALEYVEGVDLARITRLFRATDGVAAAPRTMRTDLAVHVVRELCSALSCVHRLADADGRPLGIVHRDVTPSNVLISTQGEVKLADFGIAAHGTDADSGTLRGKLSYLSPEQVSAEPYDHRSDLFSLGALAAELLLGEPLFSGAGQLAVLLAIRDARIDKLLARADQLPEGLAAAIAKAVAKHPDDRYPGADSFARALGSFEQAEAETLQLELRAWVAEARGRASYNRMLRPNRRSSAADLRAGEDSKRRSNRATSKPTPAGAASSPPNPEHLGKGVISKRPRNAQAEVLTSPPATAVVGRVRPRGGDIEEDVPFAKLVERIATGQLGPNDEVDLGTGFSALSDNDQLNRYLPQSPGPVTRRYDPLGPPGGSTTRRIDGPGVPDFVAQLPEQSVADALVWLARGEETGALFAERPAKNDTPFGGTVSKELYFDKGRLVVAASTEARELLGEHLIRRELIDRSELEMAILAMHNYDGKLGDTLVALGLVDSVDVFNCIREQGKDRVADVFQWSEGWLSFYRGVKPNRVDFPLDLGIPELLMAGSTLSVTSLQLVERYSDQLNEVFFAPKPSGSISGDGSERSLGPLPASVTALLKALAQPRPLREALERVASAQGISWDDAMRAVHVAESLGLIAPSAQLLRPPDR